MRLKSLILPTLLVSAFALGQDDGKDLFEKKVLPVMQDKCFQCHSAKAKKPAGGLRLDTKEFMAKGGKSGKLLVPGDVEKSLLIEVIRWTSSDKDRNMPPERKGGKMDDSIIKDFEAWVKAGAPDTRADAN